MFSRPTELSTTWFNAFNESAFHVCQHKVKHCEPGQQVLETRLRHQSTYHIPTSEYPECLLHYVHPTKNSPNHGAPLHPSKWRVLCTELIAVKTCDTKSDVQISSSWKHLIVKSTVGLMVQSVVSGCIPFRWAQSAETASYVEDQSSWNTCNLEVGRHISKVQKYRLLTTYYIFLLVFLEISKWLTQLFWQS